jgi:hypothetical protein
MSLTRSPFGTPIRRALQDVDELFPLDRFQRLLYSRPESSLNRSIRAWGTIGEVPFCTDRYFLTFMIGDC